LNLEGDVRATIYLCPKLDFPELPTVSTTQEFRPLSHGGLKKFERPNEGVSSWNGLLGRM